MDFSNWTAASKSTITNHLALVGRDKSLETLVSNYEYQNDYPESNYLETYASPEDKDACGVAIFAKLNSPASFDTLQKSINMLERMDHRGAVGVDVKTSDGVGIMTEIPHEIIKQDIKALPDKGAYALGTMFLPFHHSQDLDVIKGEITKLSVSNDFDAIGWRAVPVRESVLGSQAFSERPIVVQFAIKEIEGRDNFNKENKLYILNKKIEKYFSSLVSKPYLVSLSYETVVYKALCISKALKEYYLDLNNPNYKTRYGMVHQRFSTNTDPSWALAQPFRTICHNGEINTLRANINSIASREASLKNMFPKHPLSELKTLYGKNGSDSLILDSAVSRDMYFTGDIFETLLTLSPDKPEGSNFKDFFLHKSFTREAWDGPGFIGFCDGKKLGAKLDKNGLRPARYTLTVNGEFLVCSENGVIDVDQNMVVKKGRLGPGEIIAVDLEKNVILTNEVIKRLQLQKHDYGKVLRDNLIDLKDLQVSTFYNYHKNPNHLGEANPACYMYTREEIDRVVLPMAKTGKEAIGSMGADVQLAVFSSMPRLIYDYFKQIFAQVTNPPIDAIREELATDLTVILGRKSIEVNSNEKLTYPCIKIDSPFLNHDCFNLILLSNETAERTGYIETSFHESNKLEYALDNIMESVRNLISEGKDLIVLDDGHLESEFIAIPMLLAVSAVHHDLIKKGLRNCVSLLVKTSEARDVHHMSCLLGFGANAVYPELALNIINEKLPNIENAETNYINSLENGIRKVMSKIGITSIQSYQGGQLFEAVGIGKKAIDRYFTWTDSKIGGITLDIIESEAKLRKKEGLKHGDILPSAGMYSWRKNGVMRTHTPSAIKSLSAAVKLKSKEDFNNFCKELDYKESPVTLRDLYELDFSSHNSIDLEQVESLDSIVKRFVTGAMSLGSISKEAHETIAEAMNELGARSNSGEGGEDPERSNQLARKNLRSSVKQIASGRFGVDLHYLINADELQIKIAQGAKPGEGGQLPGDKVSAEIAFLRNSTKGVSLISPPPHHDIYSIEDLAQLIFDLKSVNPRAQVSVKLVSGTGIGTIASGVVKAKADKIIISGGDGGTGASPISSLFHAGLPYEVGLNEVHETLVKNGLRNRVILQTDGGLRTPKDILVSTILGAEEWGLGSVALMSIGCVMMRQCHLNSCPVGIATQNPELRRKFAGMPEHLINYVIMLATEVRNSLARLGISKLNDLIGRKDLLIKRKLELSSLVTKKVGLLELDNIFKVSNEEFEKKSENQNHGISKRFDYHTLIPSLISEIENEDKNTYSFNFNVNNLDRAIGAGLSAYIKRHFRSGVDKNRFDNKKVILNLKGVSGQSFMAFASNHISAHLIGEANDYVGKGLCGATVSIEACNKNLESPVLIGNTALYGATSGSLYIGGSAGERFGVRNSGANAVVENIGDHGLEYMTGGSVVIIGSTGKNLCAGMSGGAVYIFDPLDEVMNKLNDQNRESLSVSSSDELEVILRFIKNHYIKTKSLRSKSILENWANLKKYFKTINPYEYQLALKSEGKRHIDIIDPYLEIDINLNSITPLTSQSISLNQ